MFKKLLMLILAPMINREVRKIKDDPEIVKAEKAVDDAIDEWKISLKRSFELEKEALENARKAREEYAKSRGK